MEASTLPEIRKSQNMKARKLFAIITCLFLSLTTVMGQPPTWRATTPSVGTVGPLSIPINYGINKVGTHIWNLLISPLTFKSLITKLLEEYNVSEQTCIENTLLYLKTLSEKQLIIIK